MVTVASGGGASAVQALAELCGGAKGRVSAALRADVTAAVLAVEAVAAAGEADAMAAVAAMVAEAFDVETFKVGDLRTLGEQLGPGAAAAAIDLTAEDDEVEDNAECSVCNLPFFTASGNMQW